MLANAGPITRNDGRKNKKIFLQNENVIGNICTRASATGQVAQLVEQGIENPRAGGSSPSLTTIEF